MIIFPDPIFEEEFLTLKEKQNKLFKDNVQMFKDNPDFANALTQNVIELDNLPKAAVVGLTQLGKTADDPDVILLLIGINGGTTAQLNTLVSNIYTAKPTVKLIVAELTPKSTFQQYIVDLNTYITGTLVPYWTGEGRIIESVDLYSMFLDGNGNIDASRLSNGINHPTNEMYDQIAKAFTDGINSILF